MEISTIVLAILRADFFTPTMQLVTQASFALLFFACRVIISPIVYYRICTTMVSKREEMEKCFPSLIFYSTIVFGFFFNSLNLFCKYYLSGCVIAYIMYIIPFLLRCMRFSHPYDLTINP